MSTLIFAITEIKSKPKSLDESAFHYIHDYLEIRKYSSSCNKNMHERNGQRSFHSQSIFLECSTYF